LSEADYSLVSFFWQMETTVIASRSMAKQSPTVLWGLLRRKIIASQHLRRTPVQV